MINSRAKGKSGEREIVLLLRKFNIDVSRNLMQTREGGCDLLTDGTPLEDYAIEIKRSKSWTNALNQSWRKQAVIQAKRLEKKALLLWRQDRGAWFVEYEEKGTWKIDYFQTWLEKRFK